MALGRYTEHYAHLAAGKVSKQALAVTSSKQQAFLGMTSKVTLAWNARNPVFRGARATIALLLP